MTPERPTPSRPGARRATRADRRAIRGDQRATRVDRLADGEHGDPRTPLLGRLKSGLGTRRGRAVAVVGGLAIAAVTSGAASGAVQQAPETSVASITGLHRLAHVTPSAAAADASGAVGDAIADRDDAAQTSRSAGRSALESTGGTDATAPSAVGAAKAKAARKAADIAGVQTDTASMQDLDPREIARSMMGDFGFSSSQFGCLDSLWVSESNWRWNADNPTSSAYGIPQALPGEKMASAGSDWATNPATQIKWGLGYIQSVYGDPCSAWSFKQGNNWY
ncbi:hypothetical protein CLV56_1006 [Mumia flava]|uniref:Transglycosylase-like protein with SLT domain n=1 Tax=Mumia flava TaxID=1348852 RepID=A0A2M9BFR7_9ACTN|nr:hypothetical protein [Mumia flava]PJJ56793.1 hypothetical protein CLV56_1006 [Mumia flava]